jgi:hypothetical protein
VKKRAAEVVKEKHMREDIVHLCGDLPDWKIARIEASEASYEDLTIAHHMGSGSG